MAFDESHTTPKDISQLANDAFVFFSLEVGDTLKKGASSFGDVLMRFKFDQPVFKDMAWLTVVDQLHPITPRSAPYLPYLTEADHAELSERPLCKMEPILCGSHMLRGLALLIIRDARTVSEASRRTMLASRDDESMNALLNGLYRPEIKVPVRFAAKEWTQHMIVHRPMYSASIDADPID